MDLGVLSDFNIFLLDNARSKAYLQLLVKCRMVPAHRYLFVPPGFVLSTPTPPTENQKYEFFDNEPVWVTMQRLGLSFTVVENTDLNSEQVVAVAQAVPGKFTIYCGGPILQAPILNTPSAFIHCHPGRTPHFKGSTCFYYSLLSERKMGVTCFFMVEGLDEGPVIHQQEFEPVRGVNIDSIFDPWMRAQTLISAIRIFQDTGKFPTTPQTEGGETYFVIHPVIKSLAIDLATKHGTPSESTWSPPAVASYEYTCENRIKNVHRYSFSPFGPEFVRLYHADREKALQTLLIKELGSDLPTLPSLLEGQSFESKSSIALKNLLIAYTVEQAQEVANPWIKKYEVFKRLYTAYDEKFRKASENCDEVVSYILLGIVCLNLFQKNKKFQISLCWTQIM